MEKIEIIQQITVTQIIAIIGCVTGCISLGITIFRFLSEQFKLKIKFSKTEDYFFERLKSFPNYNTKYQAAIRVEFINSSSYPLTIIDIIGEVNKTFIRFQEYPESQLRILKSTNKPNVNLFDPEEYLVLPMDKQIILPLRLQPFDAYEGYMFFPFFPDIESEAATVILHIRTARRKKIKKRCLVYLQKPIHY
ncbi:MAG: hypothetical protein LUH21_17220 [Clostridiales bacterium]|nr:hypothetical protein [Clostridiales bacterium]